MGIVRIVKGISYHLTPILLVPMHKRPEILAGISGNIWRETGRHVGSNAIRQLTPDDKYSIMDSIFHLSFRYFFDIFQF